MRQQVTDVGVDENVENDEQCPDDSCHFDRP